jgi:hypothetical protein
MNRHTDQHMQTTVHLNFSLKRIYIYIYIKTNPKSHQLDQ